MTIQELLSELRIDFKQAGEHHHARPGWIQIRHCPFCRSDNYHLGWNVEINYASCWRCGGHRADKVLAALGVGREKAREILRYVEPGFVQSRERSRISVLEPKGKGPLSNVHRLYLLRRGFTMEDISGLAELWQVEGIGRAAKLGWRLYIPIVYRGVRVSWTTRAVGDKVAQRYISASADEEVINHKELVYGLDFCHHSVVVVEGPLDAWKIGPGAGAVFGTMFTTAQIKKLIKIPRRYVCFDSSPDAQRRAEDLANQLACFPGITENLLIDAKDPGEASPKELKLIRKVARL